MESLDPWHVRRQLGELIKQLEGITRRDTEQEVQGIALPVLDAVLSNAKTLIGDDDPVVNAAADVISPETIERGEPVRSVDALLVAETLRDSLRMPSIRNDPDLGRPSPNKPPGA